MNYKIKPEYVGQTVKVYDRVLGSKTIVVDKINLKNVAYYQSIGLKHIFEEVVTDTTPEVVVIEYKAVEGPIPESTPKPKKKRKPKTNANA
jgi:hypothetical protein